MLFHDQESEISFIFMRTFLGKWYRKALSKCLFKKCCNDFIIYDYQVQFYNNFTKTDDYFSYLPIEDIGYFLSVHMKGQLGK